MDRLPEEVLFALAQLGCARLALLCRRLAAFFARPAVRREAAPAYYFALSNKGKYLLLSRSLQDPGDAYEIIFPYLMSDEREQRRLAAALTGSPDLGAPHVTARMIVFAKANPRAAFAFSFRDDARGPLSFHDVPGGKAMRASDIQAINTVAFAIARTDQEIIARGLPLYFWGLPAKVREMRATGAPLSFSIPGPVCRCHYRAFGPPGQGAPWACRCGGISVLVAAYDRKLVSGDRGTLLAALREAALPLAREHGGDGSEDSLDLGDPAVRSLVRERFGQEIEEQLA